MLEQKVEGYLIEECKKIGALCYKIKLSVKGGPDRLIVFECKSYFVETKRPVGGVLSESQRKLHKAFKEQGVKVYVLSNFKEIDDFIEYALMSL